MSADVAIVAGAGALGRAASTALAAAGYTVVVVDRSERALAELPTGIRSEAADTTDTSATAALIGQIATELGPPAVLVNAIGAFEPGGALEVTPDSLGRMIDANLGIALWLSQAVAPHMQQRGSGAIVHVSSRPGLEPTPGMAAASVSKAALAYLTRVLDIELRSSGIRVNAIAPQVIDTAASRALLPPEVIAHAVSPVAIAALIFFLASEAASTITGAILPAYGG